MDLKRPTKNLQSVKLRNVGEGIVVHESDCVQSQFQESQFVEHRKLELVLLGEVVAEQVEVAGPAGHFDQNARQIRVDVCTVRLEQSGLGETFTLVFDRR